MSGKVVGNGDRLYALKWTLSHGKGRYSRGEEGEEGGREER